MNKILLYKNKFLITSFYNGFFCRIRFYILPLTGLYLEIPCHTLQSVNLKLDPHKELLFSCSKDGSIYIFAIEKTELLLETKGYTALTEPSLTNVSSINQKETLEQSNVKEESKEGVNGNRHEHKETIKNKKKKNESEKKDEHKGEEKGEEKKEGEGEGKEGNVNVKVNVNLSVTAKMTDETRYVDEYAEHMNENSLSTYTTKEEIKNALTENKKDQYQYQFLLYDLDNKINYFLHAEEKESDEILIDSFYLQKQTKEMLELQKKIVNQKNQMELEMKNKESIYKNEMKKLKKEKHLEIANLNKINKSLIKEKEKVETICKESIFELEEKHTYFVNQLNSQFYLTNKINDEKFAKLEEEFNAYKQQSVNDLLNLKEEHSIKIKELTKEKDETIQQKQNSIKELQEQLEHVKKEKEEYIKQLEEDVDEEIVTLTHKYEQKIKEMREEKFQLMGQSKLNEYTEQELRQTIKEEKEKFILNNIAAKRLQENIDNLKAEINALKENVASKEKEVENKNKEIADLNDKNEELEKLKVVLTQKIKNLESSLSPKNSEIKVMKTKIEEMTTCFENNHKKTVSLQIEIKEQKMKIKALHDDLLNTNKTIGNYEKILKNLQDHIKECYLHLHDKKLFNSSFINLYNKFHKVSDVKNYDSKNIFSEYIRQKEHLENMIEMSKEKLAKETEAFRKEKIKMMNENALLLKEINDLKVDLNFLKTEYQAAKLNIGRGKMHRKQDKKMEAVEAQQ